MGPVNAKFPLPLDTRFYAERVSDLNTIASSEVSYPYMKVVCKEDGYTYELLPNGTWRLFTAVGPQGRGLEFNWNGTQLGVRLEGDSSYQYVNLKGEKGNSLQFNWVGTRLGIRQEGDIEYQYVDLKGDTGTSLEFNWDGTRLGVKTSDEYIYQYQDLQGPMGEVTEDSFLALAASAQNNTLQTTAKDLVGAINELKSRIDTMNQI